MGSTRTEDSASGWNRRQFLGATGVAAAGLAAPLALAGAAAAAPAGSPTDATPLGFALISDTHLNPDSPNPTAYMRSVFAALLERNPMAILHCGDITDDGTPEQLALYQSTVPAALAGRIRYTPGNHEVRWDVAAKQNYQRRFGPTPQSFDIGGVHVVALDPTILLQEPAHLGAHLLDWLERDLASVQPGTPSVLFQHHPVGDTWFYEDDQDRFFELVERYDVRAVFAGHVHAQYVRRMNGLVEVTLNAVRNAPHYYWAERGVDAAGVPQLTVTRVDLLAGGGTTTTAVTTVPLAGQRPGAPVRPATVQVGATAATFTVQAAFGTVAPAAVQAQVLPETGFSGTITTPYTDLSGGGRLWHGAVDASTLPPGTHQVRVRALAADGTWWDTTRTVHRSGPGPRVAWEVGVDGGVQGALGSAGNVVVAASTSGAVTAFAVVGGRARQLWTSRTGPVCREPVVAPDRSAVFVPSTDHSVTALDGRTGRRRWQVRTAEPVQSTPLLASVDRRPVLFVAAGSTLLALDAAGGREIWRAPLGGFCAGRPACDGTRVYVGAGDGRSHAYDARTGALLWTFIASTRADPYGKLLYGPWDDRVALAPGGPVLAATVSATSGLDPATGTKLWSVPGSSMYASPRVVSVGGQQAILLIHERGATLLIDAATGATRWKMQLGFPVFNSGAVINGATAWVLGANSQLGAVELATGKLDRVVKLGSTYSFSTPALVGGQVIAADQNGRIRGVSIG
jgi:outer membrane protein assembly factor BamB/predicted phosphodiesterase